MTKKTKKLESELGLLRTYIEARFNELKTELRRVMEHARPVAAPTMAKKTAARAPRKGDAQLGLAQALKQNKRSKELLRAGKQRDQLLRALIPLYVAEPASIEVNSGAISAFWKLQGIAFAGPNAAKALREHVGNANKTARGWKITPNGVKYVEAALGRQLAA
jgi:hypothetical protein